MAQEIERKFLVQEKIWANVEKPEPLKILQGYILNDPNKTIRIRIQDNDAFLTVKGKTTGITRQEFEYIIPLNDAKALLSSFCDKYIEKVRYRVNHNEHLWEVDVFEHPNSGLILAEVELKDEKEIVTLPDWVGKEVSSDPRYFNANMLK